MRLSFSSRCEARTDFSCWHNAIRTQEARETGDTSSKATRRCRGLASLALTGHLICTARSEAVAGGDGPLGIYSNNRHLAGSPVAQRVEVPVDCDWGLCTSAGMASPDEFCVRWTGDRQAQALAVELHPNARRSRVLMCFRTAARLVAALDGSAQSAPTFQGWTMVRVLAVTGCERTGTETKKGNL